MKCDQVYDCLHHSLCRGGQSIMFAWAKNAPATTLPPGVSFTLDPSQKRYLVLQVQFNIMPSNNMYLSKCV